MLNLLVKLVSWLRSGTLRLLLIVGLLLVVWGLFAPIETLVWWFDQGKETLGWEQQEVVVQYHPERAIASSPTNCYVVFLTGVGDYSVDQLTPGEERFLDRLGELHPNCVTVRDVFPYSAANIDLAGNRFLAPLWRAVAQADGWLKEANVLIKIRNLWRFAISADSRYGEIYSQGIASAIIDRMNAAYPITFLGEPPKVVLVGTSGGAQVALGSVPYLNKWLNSNLIVVSVGGAFDGEAGFDQVAQVYHLHGDRDWVEKLPGVIFPSRWMLSVASPFNRARRDGKYHTLNSGPHTHDGSNGYFGLAIADSTQIPYVDLTLQTVNCLPIWSDLT